MYRQENQFAGYRHAVAALAIAAVIVSGVIVPMEARTPSLNIDVLFAA